MLGGVFGKILDRRRANTLILAWQNCIFGRRHVFMVAESGLKCRQSNLMFVFTVKHQNRLNALLYWEHDSKRVCCHPNRFILSIVM